MKYIYLLIFALILLLSLGAPSAEGNVTEVDGDTFDDIQWAVVSADENDIIELDGNYVPNTTYINVYKTLTLQGKNSATLDGEKKSNIMNVEADNVVIKDLTFKNAKSGGCGAIRIAGNNISIINCTFISNEANLGGAVMWYGHNGLISNCTFTNNHADWSGGAICWSGPFHAAYYNHDKINLTGSEKFTIENTRFNGNTAEIGGAIYSKVEDYFDYRDDLKSGDTERINPCEVISCEFTSNSAKTGGAIYWEEVNQNSNRKVHGNTLTVRKSQFSKNKADEGSAIYLYGDNNGIHESVFSENPAKYGVVDVCGNNFTVSNSSFKGNVVKQTGVLYAASSNLNVLGCEFSSNSARRASAIKVAYDLVYKSNISIINSKFTSNTATVTGAVDIEASNVTVDNCQFTKNTAENGGALYLKGYNQKVLNSKFTSNKASEYGAAIMWAGQISQYDKYSMFKNTAFTFENLDFTSNTADSAAAICFDSLPMMTSLTLKNGENLNMKAVMKNCNFTKSTARFSSAVKWLGMAEQDDWKIQVCKLQMENCNFNSNRATYGTAGALYLTGNGNTIKNSNFNSNTAGDFGGGAIKAEGNSLEIISSKFTSNKAIDNGGALSFTGNKLTVNKCEFTKNTVTNNYGSGMGGAISLVGKNSIIQNSVFKSNKAYETGGAIYIEGNGNTVKTSVFSSNTAEIGGAITTSAKTGNINYCIFDNNREFDSSKYGTVQYLTGNAVKSNVNLNSNFWGFNVASGDFKLKNIVSGKVPSTWVNLKISKGKLQFVNNKGNAVTQMPAFNFKLVDSKDNILDTVKVDNGVGEVNTSKSFYATTPTGVYVAKITKKISATKKLTAVHQTGKKITIKTLKNTKVTIMATNGKKVRPYHATSNSKGIVKFDASVLNKGTNKLQIFIDDKKYKSNVAKSTVKIKKAKATVKAPKVVRKYKKTGYFKVTVKHKTTKKPVKNTQISVMITNKGGIYVQYIIKTNGKGVASVDTKYLTKGIHKVKITSYGNYIMSGTSQIRIK